jgi:hypothetical protein
MRLPFTFLVPLLFFGCVTDEPLAPATAEGAAIRTEMRAADLAGIDRAFARLAERPHRETVDIEQLDGGGDVVAATRTVIDHDGSRSRIRSGRSGPAFDYGAFERFLGTPTDSLAPVRSPLRWLLVPGESGYEPAYLTERARDAYAYERLEEGGGAGFQATARLGEGDEQAVRLVRYRVGEAGDLRGLVVERENVATVFDEWTRLEVALSDAAEPLPERVVVDSRIAAPLTETRRFRLTRTFEPLR